MIGSGGGIGTAPGHDMAAVLRRRRQLLVIEIIIGIIVAGGIAPTIVWLCGATPPTGLGGGGGFIADAAKSTIPAIFLMTVCVTTQLRMRGRAGLLGPLTRPESRWLGYVPKGMLPRALLYTVIALATFAPLRALVCWLLDLRDLTPGEFALLNVIYGVFQGILVTPFIVLAAMADLCPRTDR